MVMKIGYKTVCLFENKEKNKDSLVILDLDASRYRVSVKSDLGVHFYSEFDSLESAKQFAEEWVK
jgi:hypothetical protein